MCALVFCAFTFCYLFFYQADLLYVEQHMLSGGKTTYERTIGAVMITLLLQLLQIAVAKLTKLGQGAHFLTYFPSLLVLTLLTNYAPGADGLFSFGRWPWIAVALVVVYVIVVAVVRPLSHINGRDGSRPLRYAWGNLLGMTVITAAAGLCGNGDALFHYRARMERCIMQGDYDKALSVAPTTADAGLTMMRACALAERGLLGERLFEYPMTSTACAADLQESATYMLPRTTILETANRHAADYRRCMCLIDGNLETFARLMLQDTLYNIMSDTTKVQMPVPKHYREALILYTRTRTNPIVTYRDEVLDADYEDFIRLLRSGGSETTRSDALRSSYAGNYWYYYYLRTKN